jgi:outer membrane protein assembly factor BamB
MYPCNRKVERVVPHPFSEFYEKWNVPRRQLARERSESFIESACRQIKETIQRVWDHALHLDQFRVAALCGCLVLVGCGDRGASSTNDKIASEKPAAAVSAWPMTRGGPALSGNISGKLPAQPAVAWAFTAASSISAEAAVVNGRVYVGTIQGMFHCLSADTGKEIWSFNAEDSVTAAPAVSGSMVYVSSNNGVLYALKEADGSEAWRFTIEEKISSGAITVKNPTGAGEWVLVNGYDGTTRVLNAADGQVIWTYQTNDYINGSPAVVDGQWVVFGGCDAQIHVVNLADGTLVHQIPANAYIPSSIATYGTMAFCGNYANQTVAFDITAGKIAWVYEDRALPFFSSPAVNDRLVLIGSRDKHLHAIHRETGESAWKFKTGGRVEGSPIVFDDGVVFGSTDGRLYAASLDTGAELWQLDLGESLVSSPAYGENQIVIGGESGTVFALRSGAANKN